MSNSIRNTLWAWILALWVSLWLSTPVLSQRDITIKKADLTLDIPLNSRYFTDLLPNGATINFIIMENRWFDLTSQWEYYDFGWTIKYNPSVWLISWNKSLMNLALVTEPSDIVNVTFSADSSKNPNAKVEIIRGWSTIEKFDIN